METDATLPREMRAIVQTGYGRPQDVLAIRHVPVPKPGPDEVLVRVEATSLHPDVWHVVTGRPYVLRLMGAGLRGPKPAIPGTDLAGVVVAVGEQVTRWRVGDAVFGEAIRGMQWVHGATFAEYATVREDWLAAKPERVSFPEAAAVPTSGIIALRSLRNEGRVAAGERVLVNGAAGGVGVLAVQIARALGAEVTGVDLPGKLDVIEAIGADHVIDGETTDWTRAQERYDVVLDVPGNHPYRRIRRVLTPRGRYVFVGHDAYGAHGKRILGSIPQAFGLIARSPFSKHLQIDLSTPEKPGSLAALVGWMEAGKLRAVIDSTYPLEAYTEAFARLTNGEGRGKIVLG